LVIIADEVEGEALATLVVNKLRGVFSVLAVKAPGFGDRKKEMLQDIAAVTGGQFISEDVGKKLENVDIGDLGHAHKVVSNKDYTTIVGGKGDKKDIDARIAQLKAQIKKTTSDFDKEKLQERLGKLAGGVAVIKVGAPTESAQKELKQRVEDAVAATRAAMEEGIVPGGGTALFNVRLELMPGSEAERKNADAVDKIFARVLEAPVRAIVTNSGKSPEEVINQLKTKKDRWVGFNALTDKIENLKDAGIIDPLKVVKTAFVNAISVAANYLTVGAAITSVPEKKNPAMGGGGIPGMGEEY
ncbi:MAG: chaperonin GroEL, partial [Parcubacteria group bacterium]|nr:chaperonin GroEL [Parcubacteria group bacterium]